MAKLINGNGNPAIYAGEDADLIASLAGNVTCIANVGNKYAATEEDANTIGLADGVIITKEGRRIQLDAGGTDLFTIPTGSSGVTNYYIIGYKLVQNADSTQVAETFVQKMSSSSETITEDTFRGGATEVYVSLYRVTQVGFDITAVDGLLPAFLDNAAIKDDIDQINSDLTNVTPITLNTGYTFDHVQTYKKNNVAYISFSLQKHIDSATSTGPLTIILSGMPKPLLNNSVDNSLYVPAAIYTNGSRELATSLIIDINGGASFIVTQEMKDVVTEVGTAIDVQIIVNTTYLIDNN